VELPRAALRPVELLPVVELLVGAAAGAAGGPIGMAAGVAIGAAKEAGQAAAGAARDIGNQATGEGSES
jgi:hypothetical protein